MVSTVLAKIPSGGRLFVRCEALAEASKILDAARGLELFAQIEGVAGGVTGCLNATRGEIAARENHGDEEVAARRGSRVLHRPVRAGDGCRWAVAVAEAA